MSRLENWLWKIPGLKKIGTLNRKSRFSYFDPEDSQLSIRQQAGILGVTRSGYYFGPKPGTEKNLALMDLTDQEFTKHLFYGTRRVTIWLKRQEYSVNRKRVQRLMRLMGLEGICLKRNLSKGEQENRIYLCLLRNLEITHSNQVWSTDITYVKIRGECMCLTPIMDWYSRYVLSWKLFNSLEVSFCL